MEKAADNAFDRTGHGMGGVTVANLFGADTILLGIEGKGDKGASMEEGGRSRQWVDGGVMGPQGDCGEPKRVRIGGGQRIFTRAEQEKEC